MSWKWNATNRTNFPFRFNEVKATNKTQQQQQIYIGIVQDSNYFNQEITNSMFR